MVATIRTSGLEVPSAAPATLPRQRLVSLDVFRGITIAAMLLVNNPGKGTAYAPLEHADWHGWTMTDLIFPFFLFIVGVAIPFSLAKRTASAGKLRGQLLGHIWLRALSLFMLGQLLQAIPRVDDTLPAGFWMLRAMRMLGYVFVFAAILALLIPWKSQRAAAWLPPLVCVSLYLLLVALFYLNQRALTSGLPAEFKFGGGMFRPDRLRVPGVLQRIGICYGVAATIALFAGWRTVLLSAVLLCTGYSALMLRAPFPGHAIGSLSKDDNLARHIDVAVLDRYQTGPDGKQQIVYRHSYSAYPDNEGILSTLPAIATTLLGVLVGFWLRTSRPAVERCAAVLAAGVLVSILGVCLGWWLMPVNKIIWTPSYTVLTAGLAMLGLGTIFWLVDLLGFRRWAFPFVIFGMNSIAAFVAAGVMARIGGMIKIDHNGRTVSLLGFAQERLAAAVQQAPLINTQGMTSLAYAIAFVLVIFALMSVLYSLRIFVKV